ncbi:hypothetical protein B0H13DRAFT_1934411 [Mycena leptocephala]|nr:hypothetical protein B0H13DRAFT_1934411 [Mycena leptocephala]
MPAVTLPAAPRSCCFVCKSSGNPRLQCQRTDWPQHRRVCRDRRSTVREQGQLRESDANELILISRWLDHWNCSLFCWGAFAANLAHQSRSSIPKLPRRKLVVHYEMCFNADVDKMIFDLVGEGEMDDGLRSFKRQVVTHDTLRIVIVCGNSFNCDSIALDALFPHGMASCITDASIPGAQHASASLDSIFRAEFTTSIANGDGKNYKILL